MLKLKNVKILQIDNINTKNVSNIKLLSSEINNYFNNITLSKLSNELNDQCSPLNIFGLFLSYNVEEKEFKIGKYITDEEKMNMVTPIYLDLNDENINVFLKIFKKGVRNIKADEFTNAFFKLMNETINKLNIALYQFHLNNSVRIDYKYNLNIPKKYFLNFPDHKRTKCIMANLSRNYNDNNQTNIISAINDVELSYSESVYAFNKLDRNSTRWGIFFDEYASVILRSEFIKEHYEFIYLNASLQRLYSYHFNKIKEILYYHYLKKDQLNVWERIFIHKIIDIENVTDLNFYLTSPFHIKNYYINIDDLFDIIRVKTINKDLLNDTINNLKIFFKENNVYLKNKDMFFNSILTLSNENTDNKGLIELLDFKNKVLELKKKEE